MLADKFFVSIEIRHFAYKQTTNNSKKTSRKRFKEKIVYLVKKAEKRCENMFGKPNNSEVKINCRKCGQPSDSSRFVLDPVYKMMVCQKCSMERKSSAMFKKPSQPSQSTSGEPMIPGLSRASPNSVAAQQGRAQAARQATPLGSAERNRAQMEAKLFPSSQPKPKEPEPAKPAGWDEDDMELERLAKYKTNENAPKVEKISDDKLKITCAKCKYRFTYNIHTQTPTSCPYCGREIDKPRGY